MVRIRLLSIPAADCQVPASQKSLGLGTVNHGLPGQQGRMSFGQHQGSLARTRAEQVYSDASISLIITEGCIFLECSASYSQQHCPQPGANLLTQANLIVLCSKETRPRCSLPKRRAIYLHPKSDFEPKIPCGRRGQKAVVFCRREASGRQQQAASIGALHSSRHRTAALCRKGYWLAAGCTQSSRLAELQQAGKARGKDQSIPCKWFKKFIEYLIYKNHIPMRCSMQNWIK